MYCETKNNTCQQKGLVGDPCAKDSECLSENCHKKSYCEEGKAACSLEVMYQECDYNQYCAAHGNNTKCVDRLKVGTNCTANTHCVEGSFCALFSFLSGTGHCVTYNSLKKGQ